MGRRMRGAIHEGRYEHCGVVPQCMGSAACGKHNCTCPTFTAAELEFARIHRLTIEDLRDMPAEWKAIRGVVPLGLVGPVGDSVCSGCRRVVPTIQTTWIAVCEECARLVLAAFASDREAEGERRLFAVPGAD